MNNSETSVIRLQSAERWRGPLRIVVFCLSLVVMVLITAWPHLLGKTTDTMDHNAAMVLMLGMSCGFVYGIGYVPSMALWRVLFSASASVLLMALGVLMVAA